MWMMGMTTAERLATVGINREPCWDTDLKQQFIFDGVTPGGIPVSAPERYLAPTSVTFTKGSTTSPLSTVQSFDDGAAMTVSEQAGAPGFDFRFDFTGVITIRALFIRYYYSGSGNHNCWIQIWNYNTSSWTTLISDTGTDATDYQITHFPLPDDANYVSAGAAAIRFYQAESGISSHSVYIDYVALQY